MAPKTPRSRRSRGLIHKLRKPIAPPTRVIEDERKYKRSRERAAEREVIKQPEGQKTD